MADTERMKLTRPRYTVVTMSNHWRVIDGEFYRDCTVRDHRRGGAVRVIGVHDSLLSGAA